jgi:signal transduction protein with GAF and PtsI domain
MYMMQVIEVNEEYMRKVKELEDKIIKERDKINRDLADRWEYLSALEQETKSLKTLIKEAGL